VQSSAPPIDPDEALKQLHSPEEKCVEKPVSHVDERIPATAHPALATVVVVDIVVVVVRLHGASSADQVTAQEYFILNSFSANFVAGYQAGT
jgi:hypothetical protein